MRISDTLILSSIYNLRRNSFKELNKFYGVHIRTLKKYLNKFVRKNILQDIFNKIKELRLAIDEHSYFPFDPTRDVNRKIDNEKSVNIHLLKSFILKKNN